MTAAEFEAQYAQRSNLTVKELRALGRIVAPCACDQNCAGWQSVSVDTWIEMLDSDYDRMRLKAALK